MKRLSIISGLLLLAMASASMADPRPDLVAKVKAGKLKEARVSWWGFDPNDSTSFLQAAINSRVPRLIVDALPNTWYATPLRCVSNQEIVFEKGARLAAKRNAFQNKGDTLLTLSLVTNVTLRGPGAEIRMFRDDYAAAPYDLGTVGFRNTISIFGCANVTIDGLSLTQSGGTAVHIDCARGKYSLPSTNIRITGCAISKSCRRGVFVAGCDGVTLENVSIAETSGYWPNSGIGIASEGGPHLLRNVTFKNCRVSSCSGYGIDAFLGGVRKQDAPAVDVSFAGCSFKDCDIGLSYNGTSPCPPYPRGTVAFTDSVFERTRRHAIKITQKPLDSVKMTFTNCQLDGCCVNSPTLPDIDLFSGNDFDPPVDGIAFVNLAINHYAAKRDWISRPSGNWAATDVKAISGKVRVQTQNSKKDTTLDSFWRKATFLPRAHEATPPRIAFRPANMNVSVTDTAKGETVALAPLKAKGNVRYAFYAEKARTVHFRARYLPINKQRGSSPIVIRPYGEEKVVSQAFLPDFHEKGASDRTLSFSVPAAGFYSMDVRPGHNAFMLTATDVPVALDVSERAQVCQGSECTLYFTPARGRPFAVFTCGAAAFDVIQQNGTSALKGEGGRDWSRFRGSSWGMNDLWSLALSKPKKGGLGEYNVDLTGMPGFFFLSEKKYWRVK